MRRMLSAAAVVAVIAGALSVTASAGAAANRSTKASTRAVHTITWGACSDPSLKKLHAQCGYLSVPLDYSNPSGAHIQLAVSRIRHTAEHYQGILLTNPGGPGGSGLNLNAFLIPVLQQEGFNQAADDYDWIGFDPRGVGSSKPAITCIPSYFRPQAPELRPGEPMAAQLLALELSVVRQRVCHQEPPPAGAASPHDHPRRGHGHEQHP